MPIEYLSVTDVAKRLGISTAAVSAYKLPQPDALIGRTRGWLPDTIDQWNANRPGRGVGGGRPRKQPAEGRPPRRSLGRAGADDAILLLTVCVHSGEDSVYRRDCWYGVLAHGVVDVVIEVRPDGVVYGLFFFVSFD